MIKEKGRSRKNESICARVSHNVCALVIRNYFYIKIQFELSKNIFL
jgi:hypothetical protein